MGSKEWDEIEKPKGYYTNRRLKAAKMQFASISNSSRTACTLYTQTGQAGAGERLFFFFFNLSALCTSIHYYFHLQMRPSHLFARRTKRQGLYFFGVPFFLTTFYSPLQIPGFSHLLSLASPLVSLPDNRRLFFCPHFFSVQRNREKKKDKIKNNTTIYPATAHHGRQSPIPLFFGSVFSLVEFLVEQC